MPRIEPYKNFRFLVEIDGIVQAGFSECSGFGSSIQVIEYRQGGDSTTVSKYRGLTSYVDLVLKWGVTDSRELYDWHLAAVNGSVQYKKNGSILMQDDRGQEKIRWNFYNAWPSKCDEPDFNAKGNDVAIETLTISYERLERVP